MRETLKRFLENTATAVENGTKAEQTLVDRFKAMAPEEFARVPRDLLDRLSDAQYREVVGRIAPDQDLPHPEPAGKPRRQRRSFRDRWLAVWLSLRAALLGSGCGLAILALGLALLPAIDWWLSLTPPVRSVAVSAWPHCGRLNHWVDGCTYQTTVERDWGTVAHQLDLSETYLRTLNKHVETVRLPAKTLLIVWRERGTLRGSN